MALHTHTPTRTGWPQIDLCPGSTNKPQTVIIGPEPLPTIERMTYLYHNGEPDRFQGDSLLNYRVEIDGESFSAQVYRAEDGGRDVLILFGSMRRQHYRRVLVTASGACYTLVDGELNPFIKKYNRAAGAVLRMAAPVGRRAA